jgi:hypothetical protein
VPSLVLVRFLCIGNNLIDHSVQQGTTRSTGVWWCRSRLLVTDTKYKLSPVNKRKGIKKRVKLQASGLVMVLEMCFDKN